MEEVGSRGGGSKIRRADACSAGMPREGDAVFLAVPPCVQLDGFRFGGVSFARSFGVGPPARPHHDFGAGLALSGLDWVKHPFASDSRMVPPVAVACSGIVFKISLATATSC